MSDAVATMAKVSGAIRLIDAGNPSGAERLLREVLAADPQHPRANTLMALVLFHLNRFPDAVRQADISIGIEPNADAFRFKALALLGLKKHKASVLAAEEAVRANPHSGLAALTLATTLENAKRKGEAEAAFRQAVSIDPGSDTFRAQLARFLLRQGKTDEAGRIEAAIPSETMSETVMMLRGELALRNHQTEKARDYALWVLSQNATQKSALRLLVQAKVARNWALGAWWRYAMFMAYKPRWMRLLIVFPVFAVTSRFAFPQLGALFLVYVLAGRLIFTRMIRQELKAVKLRKGF